MNMIDLSKNAKSRLLDKVETAIEKESGLGPVGHGVLMCLYNVKDAVENMTLTEAYKLERAVMEKEDYDPAKDKWGFGPVVVDAKDYLAFAKDAGIEIRLDRDHTMACDYSNID